MTAPFFDEDDDELAAMVDGITLASQRLRAFTGSRVRTATYEAALYVHRPRSRDEVLEVLLDVRRGLEHLADRHPSRSTHC